MVAFNYGATGYWDTSLEPKMCLVYHRFRDWDRCLMGQVDRTDRVMHLSN